MDNPHFFRLLNDQLTQHSVAVIDDHLTKNAHVAGEKAVLNAHFSIMDIWPVVRPVLVFMQGILFFKPDWATAIKVLVAGLDAIYPPQQMGNPQSAVGAYSGMPGLLTPTTSPAASNNAGADEQQH